MNKAQRLVILIGIILVFLAGLIPPWDCYEPHLARYSFLFDPPCDSTINYTQLLYEMALIVVFVSGVFFYFHTPKKKE